MSQYVAARGFFAFGCPQYVSHWCLHPVGELQSPPTPSTDTSLSRKPRPAGMTGPGSCQVTCFALGACVHKILCAPIKTEVSIFPSPVGLLLLGPAGWHLPGARPQVPESNPLFRREDPKPVIYPFTSGSPTRDVVSEQITSSPLPLGSAWFFLYCPGSRRDILLVFWWFSVRTALPVAVVFMCS